MTWRERIQQLVDRPGWRRHAPAVGSVVAHVAVIGVIASIMAAVTAEDAPRPKPQGEVLSVELVQIPDIEIDASVTPPPRAKPQIPPASLPADRRRATAPSAAPADTGRSSPNEETFYVPPTQTPGVAQGLASLMGDDPCVATVGPKARECAGRQLAKRTGPMDSMMPRTKEQIAQYYPEFAPKCQWRVGCEGGEWISSMGTRSVAKGAPGSGSDRDQPALMSGGAATLGGMNATVGRLGFNPEHTDPGFGD